MGEAKPLLTPMSTTTKLDADEDSEPMDQKEYMSMIGSLHISRLDASENQGDATSTTSDSSEHGISEAIHIETRLEHGSATTSSVIGSGDDRDNSSDRSSAGKKYGDSIWSENSRGDSSSGVNGSSETSTNGGEQVDPKTETSTSTSNEHNESQGADGSSGSNNCNGPEQTSKTERQ
ncbi:osteocalcin 2-like [Zea mays]|uniref:osteocalcin 2-like n=1 Tax=Zea mays TaxID=4577 RepID=UPI001652110B|nr:osteocalcin 2-like [Zea mays]